MIGKTERDPVIQGNNEVGRFNLKGQQKPQYLIDAEIEDLKAWKRYAAIPDEMTGSALGMRRRRAWEKAEQILRASQKRYNEECANENQP